MFIKLLNKRLASAVIVLIIFPDSFEALVCRVPCHYGPIIRNSAWYTKGKRRITLNLVSVGFKSNWHFVLVVNWIKLRNSFDTQGENFHVTSRLSSIKAKFSLKSHYSFFSLPQFCLSLKVNITAAGSWEILIFRVVSTKCHASYVYRCVSTSSIWNCTFNKVNKV